MAEFFVRADDNAFLQLLLSKKVILVEGATEFLLLPMFYKQITDHTIEEDGISVVSCMAFLISVISKLQKQRIKELLLLQIMTRKVIE